MSSIDDRIVVLGQLSTESLVPHGQTTFRTQRRPYGSFYLPTSLIAKHSSGVLPQHLFLLAADTFGGGFLSVFLSLGYGHVTCILSDRVSTAQIFLSGGGRLMQAKSVLELLMQSRSFRYAKWLPNSIRAISIVGSERAMQATRS